MAYGDGGDNTGQDAGASLRCRRAIVMKGVWEWRRTISVSIPLAWVICSHDYPQRIVLQRHVRSLLGNMSAVTGWKLKGPVAAWLSADSLCRVPLSYCTFFL